MPGWVLAGFLRLVLRLFWQNSKWVMNPFRLVSFSLIIACHFSFLLQSGELRGRVLDSQTGKPIAARVYLRDAKGQWFFVESVALKGTAVRYDKTNWLRKDAFEKHTTTSAHPFKANLPVGDYTLTVERGKEYFTATWKLRIGNAAANVDVKSRIRELQKIYFPIN